MKMKNFIKNFFILIEMINNENNSTFYSDSNNN